MRNRFLISICVLFLGFGFANAEKWDFKNPEIAAASMGMLSPLLDAKMCPNIHINEQRFIESAKVNKFLPDEVIKKCSDCYDNGRSASLLIIEKTGQKNYCKTMKSQFGKNGTMIPGLVN